MDRVTAASELQRDYEGIERYGYGASRWSEE
jgi:hypothetical protein